MEIVLFGFVFGAILLTARLNRFDTIAGMAVLETFTMAKTVAFAVGLGMILMQLEISLGLAQYHVKPLILTGIAAGALLFGIGMAILGYCPGTVAVSLGQGNVDAGVGIVGGLIGSLLFAMLVPFMTPYLTSSGAPSIQTMISDTSAFWGVTLVIATVLMGGALALNRRKPEGWKWLIAAVALALLNAGLNLTSIANHPIGASTAFPYSIQSATGMGSQAYLQKISKPGAWELWFLLGTALAGLVFALVQRTFKIVTVPDLWNRRMGASPAKRLVWSFVGGFIMLFGARLGGGCTSGHILSGGMQLAMSSLLFAALAFTAFLMTGRAFYPRRDHDSFGQRAPIGTLRPER